MLLEKRNEDLLYCCFHGRGLIIFSTICSFCHSQASRALSQCQLFWLYSLIFWHYPMCNLWEERIEDSQFTWNISVFYERMWKLVCLLFGESALSHASSLLVICDVIKYFPILHFPIEYDTNKESFIRC